MRAALVILPLAGAIAVAGIAHAQVTLPGQTVIPGYSQAFLVGSKDGEPQTVERFIPSPPPILAMEHEISGVCMLTYDVNVEGVPENVCGVCETSGGPRSGRVADQFLEQSLEALRVTRFEPGQPWENQTSDVSYAIGDSPVPDAPAPIACAPGRAAPAPEPLATAQDQETEPDASSGDPTQRDAQIDSLGDRLRELGFTLTQDAVYDPDPEDGVPSLIVASPAEYPEQALRRDVQAACTVTLDVTELGETRNICAVCSHDGGNLSDRLITELTDDFLDASINAVLQSRYSFGEPLTGAAIPIGFAAVDRATMPAAPAPVSCEAQP